MSLHNPSLGAAVCGVAARLLYRSYPEALLNALPAMAKEILREGQIGSSIADAQPSAVTAA